MLTEKFKKVATVQTLQIQESFQTKQQLTVWRRLESRTLQFGNRTIAINGGRKTKRILPGLFLNFY